MKLGDKMSMEAYNAWRGPAPRKCRPPKIGDIPKHGAVDEESPESSAGKLTLSPVDSRESASPDIPLDSTRNTAFPLGSASATGAKSETRKSVLCTGEKDTAQFSSIVESRLRSPERDALSPVHPVQKEAKDSQRESSHLREKSYALRTPSPEYPGAFTETDDSKSRITIRLSSTEGNSWVRVKSPSEESSESPRVPWSPEESSQQDFSEVRKDSALFLEETEGLPWLRELVKTRAPRIVGPRRESSGYASNLGTFDEDRRNSSTPDPLQDLSTFLKERRRSSTKRQNSRIGLVRPEDSLTEEFVYCSYERMPTTEVYRKVSSAGLEMPNIEEVKEVLREDAPPRQESLDNLCSFVERITADELSVRCRIPEDSSSHDTRSTNEIPVGQDYLRDHPPKIDVSRKEEERSRDVFNLTPLGESISTQASTHSVRSSHNRIIHQYSAPHPREEPQEPKATGSVCSSQDDDDDVSVAVSSATSLQPRSVKMYQLLSTQSEDAGDPESRFTDRRISLQISRPEETILSSTAQSEQLLLGGFEAGTKPKSALQGESKIGSSEGGASTPVRKLSSPDEMGASQSFPGDVLNVTVRPIYPYFPYSPYGSPQGSPRNGRKPLRESRRVSIDNKQGALQLNQYKLLNGIGQGSYGIVKLVYNEEDETYYAMKILSKKKLMKKAGIFGRMAPGRKGAANPLAKVYREIALLKKLDHPNVVKLVEVLDDPDEDDLYLVFELVQKGEVLEVPTDKPLDVETARKNFRDVVLGVEYLHYQRIVHRDIKPSNLLVDSEGRVKIADLGVSAELRASGELLSGPTGTPAFAAPETTILGAHYSGTLCDVWSMGVTLYSLVTGKIPWDAGSIIALQQAVHKAPLKFPEKPELPADLRDLIARMLEKEPARRITLAEIKVHPWLTRHGAEALPSEVDNCRLPVTVTDAEVERVVTRVPKLNTLILIKTMVKQHSFQNPFLPKKSRRSTASETSREDLSSSDRSTAPSRDKVRNCKSERFQRSGRSNSAPDSYNWQTNGRQISVDSPLPPVTEAACQEAEVEKR